MVAQFTGKKVGLVSVGLLAFGVTSLSQAVFAQGYDMSTFDGYGPGVTTAGIAPTNQDQGWISPNFGQAQESLGAHGTAGRTSFRTGDRARDQNSGHVTGFSNTQRHGVVQNVGYQHLLLPHTSTGGLAPIFGLGSSQLPGPMFTTPLEDPISIGNFSINPGSGQINARIGDVGLSANSDSGIQGQIGSGSVSTNAGEMIRNAQSSGF
jgi:hypothetical protein